MCGIAGIYSYQNSAQPVNRKELLDIREAMATRGPDGAGIWIADNMRIGLAHRRLSIIDLTDSAAQPMAAEDGHLHIVFNGEIYNYRSLRTELKKKGYRFMTNSDTEVLLHLYSDRGDAMVESLRGMYAFAIWDGHKNALLLARDPLGIKPLYIANDGSSFRFASQVKALLQSKRVVSEPEAAGHVGFFLWGSVPEPYTLYRGIRALPAGTTLWVDDRGVGEPSQFFSITEELLHAEQSVQGNAHSDPSDILREALQDSVRHHFIADVPVGIFLSSGLDSTSLTALATELHTSPLHTITLGFKEYQGSNKDETPLAETVARHYGCQHHTQWVTQEEFQGDYDRLLSAMDQPTIDGVNTYFISKAAAQAGFKVAISGLGGDELFGGYPSFRDVPRMVRLLSPFSLLPRLGKMFRLVSGTILKRFTSPKYAGLLEFGGTYAGAYLLRRGLFMPWELPGMIDADMVREGWRELQPLIRLEDTVRGISMNRLKLTALESTWYMRNQLLRDADWAGMAHSLEIRVPLVDIELFRSVARLVATRHSLTKCDVASVLATPLPQEVLAERKKGFSVPIREWATHLGKPQGQQRGLRGWARDIYESCMHVA